MDSATKQFVRCEACGDSKKHPWKKHRQIYPDGGTFCHRCGDHKQLSFEAFLALMLNDVTIEEAMNLSRDAVRVYTPELWSRGQLLDQYSLDDAPLWVSYEMRDCNGKRIGWHNRHMKVKEVENEGKVGIGFVGQSLVSSPSRPLILTEGPCDVLTERHVCTFGTITASKLKHTRLQYMWLQPDPDQIDTALKRKRFVERVVRPAIEDSMCFVQGVIVGNADPDEATILHHVPTEALYQWL